jgi:hypothetical protein
MQDGYAVGNIGAAGVDSRFRFAFFAAGAELESFEIDPPIDEAYFFGVVGPESFDRIEVWELAPADHENDFFGDMYADPSPPTP